MKYKEIELNGNKLKWSATQDSEHPDFILNTEKGEIWVQVEVGVLDKNHNELYLREIEEYPISECTVKNIVTEIVNKGYDNTYFESDVGLIYTENGVLIEN